MEKKVVLIQTDLVDKGLVKVEDYKKLVTYVMLCEIEKARIGNNIDFTTTNPSMWLPISALPTITYSNLIKYLAASRIETDRYKMSEVHTIRSNDDRLDDYMLINYDEKLYEGLNLHNSHDMYIKHIFREVFDKEI